MRLGRERVRKHQQTKRERMDETMASEADEKLPRDFYDGIVSIKNELEEYGVPDEDIENALDSIEEIIIDAMEHCVEESEVEEKTETE